MQSNAVISEIALSGNTYKERPFHTILSCAAKMYDEL